MNSMARLSMRIAERITAVDIELAVARHFNWRMNIIIPNVSWGLLPWGHEVDVLIIRPSGFAEEIEIKISGSDIKADIKKWHRQKIVRAGQGYWNEMLRRLWFAVPKKLSEHPDIPAYAGILAYQKDNDGDARITTIRTAAVNKMARRLTPAEHSKALHLGCMRIWSLKEALKKAKERNGSIPSRPGLREMKG